MSLREGDAVGEGSPSHTLSWQAKKTRSTITSQIIAQCLLFISHLMNFLILGNFFNTLIICPIKIEMW